MLYELGILFKTDDLSEADYQKRAWQTFMTTCDPLRLSGSTFYEGKIEEAVTSQEEMFCIAVQTQDRRVIHDVKTVFMLSNAPGLMSSEQRFIERGVTLRYPLSIRGRIDASGQFCSWQETFVRRDRQLCADSGWEFGGFVKSSAGFGHGPVLVEEVHAHEFSKANIRPRSGSGPDSGGKAGPLPPLLSD